MIDNSSPLTLILASGSPRRRELLQNAGLQFLVISPDVDELLAGALPAEELCLANAALKADAVALDYSQSVVLASDTVVALEGIVFGKPASLVEAAENLRKFRGKTHQVMTGVALWYGEEKVMFSETSQVTFRNYSDLVIDDYLKVVPVLDKAGGYAIQDHGEWLVEEIKGDYDNIVGLPLTKVLAKFAELGFDFSKNDA